MPRAIWSGSISFGLANVPVRMFSAIDENDLRFHLIHEPDSSRIGYQKICKTEEKPVPDDEIVKGFEFEKDEYVVLSDEDFEAARTEGVRTIEISDFVPYEEIDPIYFERTYYLGPQEGGEKVYALLRNAMEKAGLAAIAKYVMRDRQSLGCLRVREGTLTLEKMFFHDELRPLDEIAPKGIRIAKGELEMATALIEQFTGPFEPERYEDTYREALCKVIKAKRKGKTITAPEPEAEEEPADLLAALKASVEAAKQTKGSTRPKRSGAGKSGARKPPARKRKATKR
ncbi:MAG: Ku protein [Actinobacteria bacterium]|nr:Ku protein [Actinomycetota bacterium]